MAHSMGWARRLLRELPKNPPDLLRRRSYADPAFLDLFFEWLDDRIFHDPHAGLRWAKVTPDLALKVTQTHGPRQEHRSRLVKAWAILGGAYRAVGRPDDAEDPYREAQKLIDSEPISDLVRADTERRLSTLRACQGRPNEALKLATGAVEQLRKIDDAPLGEALVARGYILASALGRYAEAINAFGEAIALVGNSVTPAGERLHEAACNNLAMALSDSGSFADQRTALLYIGRAHQLLKGQVRTPARYRLYWIEGLIWNQLGSHARAERHFRRALKGFEVLSMPWEVALVGLDLAALLHVCGDLVELEKLASKTFKRFKTLSNADTQTLATLSLWMNAVRARGWIPTEDEGDDEGKALRKYHGLQEGARRVILAGVVTGQCCKTDRKRHP